MEYIGDNFLIQMTEELIREKTAGAGTYEQGRTNWGLKVGSSLAAVTMRWITRGRSKANSRITTLDFRTACHWPVQASA